MDPKKLFSKLERNLGEIQHSPDLLSTLSEILRRLVDDFEADIGLVGGRIYVRRGADYWLEKEYPREVAPADFRIPASYPPVRQAILHGYVLRRPDDPGVDPALEERIGGRAFAAICIGSQCRHMMAFSLREGSDPDQVTATLNTIRHVINLKLRKEELEGRVAQARLIQMSLLPESAPEFGDFDVWGRTEPAEEVGGDLYDFIPVSERSLGITIADASGHGLPAALQARDAIIGLRMGVEERMRITATIEKLNRVIGRSALSTKFVSLFYAELERNGTLVYCNAGHNPPMLLQAGAIEELTRGGLILGPHEGARYERGYARLDPGAVLLAFSDGITEAMAADGEPFDTGRLRELLLSRRWERARDLVDTVFERVRAFSGTDTPVDDQTVVAVVRRP
jgi:sigma-B regulation protein RsbU (phosphoserine phosphatase)